MILFDIGPVGGGVGVGLAVFVILVGIGGAFLAFKMLKKTVKMAIRIIIVVSILTIAIVGGTAFLILGTGGGATKTPVRNTR